MIQTARNRRYSDKMLVETRREPPREMDSLKRHTKERLAVRRNMRGKDLITKRTRYVQKDGRESQLRNLRKIGRDMPQGDRNEAALSDRERETCQKVE